MLHVAWLCQLEVAPGGRLEVAPCDFKLNGQLPEGRGEGRVRLGCHGAAAWGWSFHGLDAGDAVELGELLAFVSEWLASDPNRLDASLYEFVGVPDYVGRVCTAEELRAEVSRFAGMLLGYAVNGEEL
jgi:hypothetical protein